MQLFTTAEAASYLRLKERKIYEMVAEGTVPCTKVTGRWLFPKADLDHWLASSVTRPEVYFFYTVFKGLRKKALRFQVGAPAGHRIDSLSGFCAFPSASATVDRLVFSAVLGSVRKDA